MPYEIVVPMKVAQSWRPQWADYKASHSLFLNSLARSDGQLADTVHEARIKPFAQSLLKSYDDFAADEERLCWRITLLDDGLYEPLMAGLYQRPEGDLHGRPFCLQLDQIRTRHETYDALFHTEPAQRLHLRLLTPTLFKQQHHMDPMPDPYRCVQSWWSRWHHFAPQRVAINVAILDIATAHLAVNKFALRTNTLVNGEYHLTGSVGRLSFIGLRRNKLERHWWQHLATLALFAQFCGTGYKTPQGFGQTGATHDS